jgi:hypothetical protein
VARRSRPCSTTTTQIPLYCRDTPNCAQLQRTTKSREMRGRGPSRPALLMHAWPCKVPLIHSSSKADTKLLPLASKRNKTRRLFRPLRTICLPDRGSRSHPLVVPTHPLITTHCYGRPAMDQRRPAGRKEIAGLPIDTWCACTAAIRCRGSSPAPLVASKEAECSRQRQRRVVVRWLPSRRQSLGPGKASSQNYTSTRWDCLEWMNERHCM